jgi:hydroxymethylglutaryl-CoA reductase
VIERAAAADSIPAVDGRGAASVLGMAADAGVLEAAVQALAALDGEPERLVIVAVEAEKVRDALAERVTMSAAVAIVPGGVGRAQRTRRYAKEIGLPDRGTRR